MTLSECIQEMIYRSRKNRVELTRELGLKDRSSISNYIAGGNVRTSVLLKIAESCGYEIQLIRKNPDLPERPIVLDEVKGRTK